MVKLVTQALQIEQIGKLRIAKGGLTLYCAGMPAFMRNFTRDSIVAAILFRNPDMLKDQLDFSAQMQGKKMDPLTGEEPGKIHHEIDYVTGKGVCLTNRDDHSTTYNACDTTALFLIGHKTYQALTGDRALAESQRENIELAAEYIVAHVNEKGLFEEDPRFSGAKQYALKVTYWKDSEIANRENGEPKYGVSYTLAHVQNMVALREAAVLLEEGRLREVSEKMRQALHERLYDKHSKQFYIAIDTQGPITGVSSDMLHALFYLDPSDISNEQLEMIISQSDELKTEAGFRALSPMLTNAVSDPYHRETVWVFEQAIIAAGASKFGIEKIIHTAIKVLPYSDEGHELLYLRDTVERAGCAPQLWSIAAREYLISITQRNQFE